MAAAGMPLRARPSSVSCPLCPRHTNRWQASGSSTAHGRPRGLQLGAVAWLCCSGRAFAATRLVSPAAGRGLGRRHALEVFASIGLSGVAGSSFAWHDGPPGRLGARSSSDALADSPQDAELRSVNELADLAREQRAVRSGTPPTRADARAATLRLLGCTRDLDRAMELASERRWDELSLKAQAVREEVERSVAVILASEVATLGMRSEIGWEWGHCGWRRCGIQADVVQTLCKLREGMGIFVPAEARLYVDVARRGLDELLRALEGAGLLTGAESAWLGSRVYLPRDDLDLVLGEDTVNGEGWEL
ncbi:hypothetical protein T492DRAFT_1043744 [Pavlovales sp. CCMP2436]|nr:hypothetical protein T492DRAFT_1043744 [Pavlovales sp. CCMP2436]